jgi:hypothetical protein
MPLIELIIVIALIGVVMWAINTYVPMSAGRSCSTSPWSWWSFSGSSSCSAYSIA